MHDPRGLFSHRYGVFVPHPQFGRGNQPIFCGDTVLAVVIKSIFVMNNEPPVYRAVYFLVPVKNLCFLQALFESCLFCDFEKNFFAYYGFKRYCRILLLQ